MTRMLVVFPLGVANIRKEYDLSLEASPFGLRLWPTLDGR